MDKSIVNAINRGLIYLKNKQVSGTRYKNMPEDFCVPGQNRYFGLDKIRSFTGNYIIPEKHLLGCWPAFVSFNPTIGPKALQPLYMSTDYNLFVTVSTSLCLRFLDETSLPAEYRYIDQMRLNALQAIEQFKRGETYNFWKIKTSSKYPYSFSAPENIPAEFISIRKYFNKITGLWGLHGFHEAEFLDRWIDKVYDRRINKTGTIAMFNIPSDSDDTSLALSLKLISRNAGLIPQVDIQPLKSIQKYRDLNRTKTDRLNKKLDPLTGAYLTWHKDDHIPVFTMPESGIIPLETNNIDLVVNSNVLMALSLANMSNEPGYLSVINLLSNAVHSGLWKEMQIYYPEKLSFPYAFSRAISVGKIKHPLLQEALIQLITQLIHDQSRYELTHPGKEGVFEPFDGKSHVLATALGLNTLLNAGPKVAAQAGLTNEYQSLIHKSIKYLMSQAHMTSTADAGLYWQSGPLFSSSVHELAYWYSNALSTAMVIEALCKYYLGYDLFEVIENEKFVKLSLQDNTYTLMK